MAETYTTDFESVQNDSQTTYTPQELVQKSGQIAITEAEAQWKGVSTTEYETKEAEREESGSAQAQIVTLSDTNSDSDSGTTTGDTDIQRDTRTLSNESSGQYGQRSGSISVSVPDIPQPTGSNSTIIPERIEVDYYVDERSGGDDTNIVVEWDDDPYDLSNYDSQTRLNIDGNEKKRVGGFSQNIRGMSDFNRFDGGQIRFEKTGDRFGTSGLIAELTVTYTIETTEKDIDRERIRVSYPPKRSGYNFDVHVIKTYINDSLENTERRYTYNPGELFTTESPPVDGDTKRVVIETRSTKRETQSDTELIPYPDTPDGYSVEEYEIERFQDGTLESSELVYSDSEGDVESITSTNPSTSVSMKITGRYSKTITITENTRNPSLDGDYLSDRLNTDTVVFLMDTSGSANQTKQQDIARQIVSILSDESQAALIDFDFNTRIVTGLDTLSNNRDSLIDGINSLDSSGGTDIGQALLEANSLFNGGGGTIVLLSDGESSDNPREEAQIVKNDGREIISVYVGNGDEPLMRDMATITNGEFFDNTINTTLIGESLTDGELSEWKELSGFDRTEQTLTHQISGSGLAEFRVRFTWVFATAQPTNGTVGFRDDSDGVWREVAVAEEDDDVLQYSHVQVYNDDTNSWGALDVVDITNEAAIESHQFYDEDVGWLAPREYQAV